MLRMRICKKYYYTNVCQITIRSVRTISRYQGKTWWNCITLSVYWTVIDRILPRLIVNRQGSGIGADVFRWPVVSRFSVDVINATALGAAETSTSAGIYALDAIMKSINAVVVGMIRHWTVVKKKKRLPWQTTGLNPSILVDTSTFCKLWHLV